MVGAAAGGLLVVGVDNLATLENLAALAEDRFEYGPAGALRSRALHGYTVRSLLELMERLGCTDVQVDLLDQHGHQMPDDQVAALPRSLGRVTVGSALSLDAGPLPAATLYAAALLAIGKVPAGFGAAEMQRRSAVVLPSQRPEQLEEPSGHGGFPGIGGLVRQALLAAVPADATAVLVIGADAISLGSALSGSSGCHVTPVSLSDSLHDDTSASVGESPLASETPASGAGAGGGSEGGSGSGLVFDAMGKLPSLPSGAFDAIVAADCLERVADPQSLVASLTELLSPGGSLVSLVCNTANIDILATLAEGRWDLDPGVLHPLTRSGLVGIMKHSGLEVEYCIPSGPVPPSVQAMAEGAVTSLALGAVQLAGITRDRAIALTATHLLVSGIKSDRRSAVGRSETLASGSGAVDRAMHIGRSISAADAVIVVALRDEAELFSKFVAGVTTSATTSSFQFCIVDNGSRDAISTLQSTPNDHITVHHNIGDAGVAAAWNQAVAISRSRIVVLCDRGVEVSSGWLDAILKCFDRDNRIGVVGPVVLAADGSIQSAGLLVADGPDGSLTVLPIMDIGFTDSPSDSASKADRVDGSSGLIPVQAVAPTVVAVRRDVLDVLGPFNERLCGGDEVVDLCLKAAENGYVTVVEPSSVVTLRTAPRRLLRMQSSASATLLTDRWSCNLPLQAQDR